MSWEEMKKLTPAEREEIYLKRRREERPFDEAWAHIGFPCIVTDGETRVTLTRHGAIARLIKMTNYAMYRKMHTTGYKDVHNWGGLLMKLAAKEGWTVEPAPTTPKEPKNE